MRKVICLCILSLCLIGVLFAQPTDEQIRQAANTLNVPYSALRQFVLTYQNNSIGNVIEVDVVTLYNTFMENIFKGESLYKGKRLRISGTITSIERDYIVLRGARMYPANVEARFYFRPSEVSKIVSLDNKKHLSVVVLGACEGLIDNNIIFRDIVLIEY